MPARRSVPPASGWMPTCPPRFPASRSTARPPPPLSAGPGSCAGRGTPSVAVIRYDAARFRRAAPRTLPDHVIASASLRFSARRSNSQPRERVVRAQPAARAELDASRDIRSTSRGLLASHRRVVVVAQQKRAEAVAAPSRCGPTSTHAADAPPRADAREVVAEAEGRVPEIPARTASSPTPRAMGCCRSLQAE